MKLRTFPIAALVVAALWFGLPQGGGRPHEMAGNGKPASGLTAQQSPARAIEYPADNVEVFTFDDQEEGLSVVWLSYNEHN